MAAGAFNALRKSFSDKSDTIAPMTKTFVEAFNKRIATYKNDIAQSKAANLANQEAMSRSNQATAMATPPLVNLDNQDITIAEVETLTDFKAPDRSAHQIRLEENFPNLGPSTPENLVSALEGYICGATIQNLNNEIMPVVGYGANYVNEQLFKKANAAIQPFLNGLQAKAVDRYAHHKAGKKQAERQEQERKEKGGSSPTPSAAPSKGEKKSTPPSTLAHDAKKAIYALKEGEPVTMADVRAAAYLIERPICIVDEKGDVQHVMGAKKSGDPIFLRVIRDTKGGLSHMEPLNLTTAQKEHYKGLDHTKNDCMFNALFVHLPKEKQELFRDVQVATAQHIKANPKIYNDLYIYQEKLRQIAPAEVPRVGFFPVIPVVQAGLAAWTFYHLCQTGRAIVNDPKVQESWEERKYINTLIYSARYLPVVGDGIGMSDAWGVGDYRNAGLHAANALVTLYVGQVIGKGGRYLFNRVIPKFGNVVGQLGGKGGMKVRTGMPVSKDITQKLTGQNAKWKQTVAADGKKIYQRNELFDPNQVSDWTVKGKKITGTNIERMAAGRAPLCQDGKSLNLHHIGQGNESNLIELTGVQHKKYSKQLHINPNTIPSDIDRSTFKAWMKKYWINRAKEFK